MVGLYEVNFGTWVASKRWHRLSDTCEKKNPQLLGDFRETVLEGKLIPRAPLQDSEPPRAGDSISDVFWINRLIFKGQEKRVETRGESRGRNPSFPRWGGSSLNYKGISLVNGIS